MPWRRPSTTVARLARPIGLVLLLIALTELAYSSAGAPPAIGPNETLVFVVDPVEVR